MKDVNMIWKRQNYTGSNKRTKKNILGTNQLKKSLEHSLRLISKMEMEFNKELSGNNLIFSNGKIIKLDDISIKDRRKLLNDIIDPILDTAEAKTKKTNTNQDLSKYKYKLDKMLISNPDDPDFTNFINNIIEADVPIDKKMAFDIISGFDLKRKNEKIKCLEIYIDLKNKLLEKNIDVPETFNRKRTVMQEAFWKFPFNQNIQDIKPEDYIEIINKFYKENFPNHNIELIVFHGDEVVADEDINKAVHPHIFINGKNNKTNEFDLSDQEYKLINKFRIENGIQPLEKDGFYSTSVSLGMDYQEIIYKFVNKELKERGYNYNVVIQEDTPERALRRKIIKKDASLPKIHRLYNLLNFAIEKIKNNEAIDISLTNKIEKLNKNLTNLDASFIEKRSEYNAKLQEHFKKSKENTENELKALKAANAKIDDTLKNEIKTKQKEKEAINNDVKSLTTLKSSLKEDNNKLSVANKVLEQKILDIQKRIVVEIKDIFNKMNNLTVILTNDYYEPNKSFVLNVVEFFQKGKNKVTGLSAFLTKSQYSDDAQLEAKILEQVKPKFNTNYFMSLKVVDDIFNDALFAKENPDQKIINDKVIKPLLKDKKEDDIIFTVKEKELSVYKDHLVKSVEKQEIKNKSRFKA